MNIAPERSTKDSLCSVSSKAQANPWEAPTRRVWKRDQWSPMVCVATWMEVQDIRTFLLMPEDGSSVSFNAGQYMTFRIPTPQGMVERCYTISSSASRAGGIEITVKRQPNGAASGPLHDFLKPGISIEARGPSGSFSPAELPEGPYALIGAGSGVTPMLSVLRTAADRGIDLDAVFLHVARSTDDAIAVDDIRALQKRLPNLRIIVFESPDQESQLTPDRLNTLIPDIEARVVMCCGPAPFMEMVQETAKQAGLPADRYAQESFDFSSWFEESPIDACASSVTISLERSGKSFSCPKGVAILRAAHEAGIAMASSCSRGECGTCKTFKHGGEVKMAHNGGLRQREIDRGFILPCVCTPLSDVVLDL